MLEVSEKLYNAATEAICSALTVCEDTDNYSSLAHILVTEVKKLAPVFQASILSEDLDRLVLHSLLLARFFEGNLFCIYFLLLFFKNILQQNFLAIINSPVMLSHQTNNWGYYESTITRPRGETLYLIMITICDVFFIMLM